MKILFPSDVVELLKKVDETPALELEGQSLAFFEWDNSNRKDSVEKMIQAVIGVSNGGGGTIIFGVKNDVIGAEKAVVGVPEDLNLSELVALVYNNTSPHLKVFIEEFKLFDKRLFLMNIPHSMPYVKDMIGKGQIRVGRRYEIVKQEVSRGIPEESEIVHLQGDKTSDVYPLSKPSIGDVSAGADIEESYDYDDTDFTSSLIKKRWGDLVSPSSIEALRTELSRQHISENITKLKDEDLLKRLGVIKGKYISIGGLLTVGSPDAIKRYLPRHEWSYRRMKSDTELLATEDGHRNILSALFRLLELINVDNTIITTKNMLFHHEYPLYNTEALRESLLNAFCHRDYAIPGAVMVKHYKDRIEISNPGGFMGGITTKNILHHDPVPRNKELLRVLQCINLVNRSNLGVPRIFTSFLKEGKAPPTYIDYGEMIKLVLFGKQRSRKFIDLVNSLEARGYELSVDHLLIMYHMMNEGSIAVKRTIDICFQRPIGVVKNVLNDLKEWGIVRVNIHKSKGSIA